MYICIRPPRGQTPLPATRLQPELSNRGLSLFWLFLFITVAGQVGCKKSDRIKETTPTTGSLVVFSSPAVTPVIQAGADQFNRLYAEANVNVYPLDSRAIVDSLLQRCTDAAYFDRRLTSPESLAIVQSRKHIYAFLLGSTVATWIVHPDNQIAVIDSSQLMNLLTGKVKSWSVVGGEDEPIQIYLPPLGDGAWQTLQNFFGPALTQVEAHYWPSDSLVIERVAEDPGGLGLLGTPPPVPRVKKLRWKHPLLADPVPANISSLQTGQYPFCIRLYYYTIADRTDLASGFLSFMAANQGQRIIADHGFLPEMVPVRIVNLSPTGDQK